MMSFIWIALYLRDCRFYRYHGGNFCRRFRGIESDARQLQSWRRVAAASIMYLLLSVVLVSVQRYLNPPLWLVTLIFVPAAFALSWVGTMTSNWFVIDHKTWGVLIIIYCGVASVIPVWRSCSPWLSRRIILYSALALGIVGVFFGGYEIQQPAFKSVRYRRHDRDALSVSLCTIACGACSDFTAWSARERLQNKSIANLIFDPWVTERCWLRALLR